MDRIEKKELFGCKIELKENEKEYVMRVDFGESFKESRIYKSSYEKDFLDNPETFEEAKELFFFDFHKALEFNGVKSDKYVEDLQYFIAND